MKLTKYLLLLAALLLTDAANAVIKIGVLTDMSGVAVVIRQPKP